MSDEQLPAVSELVREARSRAADLLQQVMPQDAASVVRPGQQASITSDEVTYANCAACDVSEDGH